MTPPIKSNIAKAGVSFLKKLVMDESTLEADNRRTEPRTQVVGEVDVIVVDEMGKTLSQARVFVRDLSKRGCGLWSRIEIPAGSNLIVSFAGGPNTPPMRRLAVVRHCRGGARTGFAVGVAFTDSKAESRAG